MTTSYFRTAGRTPELAEIEFVDGTFSPEEGLDFHFTGSFEYTIVNQNVWGYNGPVVEAFLIDQTIVDSATLNTTYLETQLSTTSDVGNNKRMMKVKINPGQIGADDRKKNVRFKVNTSQLNGDASTDREAIRKIREGALILFTSVDTTGANIELNGISYLQQNDDMPYRYGDSLIFSAIPLTKGYEFSHWDAPGLPAIDSSADPVVNAVFDASCNRHRYNIRAVYRIVPAFTVNIQDETNGGVLVYSHNSWELLGSGDEYDVFTGDTILVVAKPDPGYAVDYWESDNGEIDNSTDIMLIVDDSFHGELSSIIPRFAALSGTTPPGYGTCRIRAIVRPESAQSDWYDLYPGTTAAADANGNWNVGMDITDYSQDYRIQGVSYNAGGSNQLIPLNNQNTHRLTLAADQYDGIVTYYLEPVRYTVEVEKELLNSQDQPTSNNNLYVQMPVRLQDESLTPTRVYRNHSSDPGKVKIIDVPANTPVSVYATGVRNTSIAFDRWHDGDGYIVPPASNPPVTYDHFTFSLSPDSFDPAEAVKLKAVYRQTFSLESITVKVREYLPDGGSTEKYQNIQMGDPYLGQPIMYIPLDKTVSWSPPASTFEILLHFSDPVDFSSIKQHPSPSYNLFASDYDKRIDYLRMGYSYPNEKKFVYVPQTSPIPNIYSPGSNGKNISFQLRTYLPEHDAEFPDGVCPTRMLPIKLEILSGADGVKSTIGSTLKNNIEIKFETIGPGMRIKMNKVDLKYDGDDFSQGNIIFMTAGGVYKDGQNLIQPMIEKRLPRGDGSWFNTDAPCTVWPTEDDEKDLLLDISSIPPSYKISIAALCYDLDCGSLSDGAMAAIDQAIQLAVNAAASYAGIPEINFTTPLLDEASKKANDVKWYCAWWIDPDDYIGSAEWHLYKESFWGTVPSAVDPEPLVSGSGNAKFYLEMTLIY